MYNAAVYFCLYVVVVVVVVVFFTLTDRASTIPNNTRLPIRYVVCWTEKDQRNIYVFIGINVRCEIPGTKYY